MRSSPDRSIDPRAVAVGGLTTFAWYAVPDVVGPRWARALTKSAVAVAGAALAVGVTRDGAQVRAELRTLRDQVDDAGSPGVPGAHGAHDAPDADNPSPVSPAADTAEVLAPRQAMVGAAAAVGVAAFAALGIAGEKLVYRGAEALRAHGVRRPHVLVGLGMGVLAAGLSALDLGSDDVEVS